MTQQEFGLAFNKLLTEKNIKAINTSNCPEVSEELMLWYNPQQDEFNNDFVEEVGIDDSTTDVYITFDNGCTAYSEDLEHNSDDAWDMLWDAIQNVKVN